jgi:hypothetical protein
MPEHVDIHSLPTLKRGGPVTLDLSWRPTVPEPFLYVFSTRLHGPADDPFLQKCRQVYEQRVTARITVADGRGGKVAADAYVTHCAEHQEPDGSIAWDIAFGVVSIVPDEPQKPDTEGGGSA